MELTWLDYIIFLTFFIPMIMGLARGVIRELISLVMVIIALVVMIKFTSQLAYFLYYTKGSRDVITFIGRYIYPGDLLKQIGFFTLDLSALLLFIGTMSIGEAVNYYAFADAFTSSVLSLAYRLIGAVVGCIRGYIFSVVLVLMLSVTPMIFNSAWINSYFVPRLQNHVKQLGDRIQPGGYGRFADWSPSSKT